MCEHRFGYVTLVGQTNVGKSTLLNRLVNFPLAIVTPKPQTTRHRIAAIATNPQWQIVFLDTPGLLEPRYALHEAMMRTARRAIVDADLILYVVEARRGTEATEDLHTEVLGQLRAGLNGLLAINKVDLVRKETLLPQIADYARFQVFQEIVPISALTGDGVDLLEAALVKHLPVGPPLYPPDQLTDQPERFLAAEIVRGVVFEHYGEEIPYSTAVETVGFRERGGNRKDHVVAEIHVERDSQKGILIGKGGTALRKVGIVARKRIERSLGRPVYLELRVKVRPNWRRNAGDVAALGY